MAPATNENRPRRNGYPSALLSLVIIVAILYFARVVFIPFSLAVLLAFLLAPLAIRLRHWGLGRVPSSVLVVALSFFLISIVGLLMTAQLTDLARKAPEYQQNVR